MAVLKDPEEFDLDSSNAKQEWNRMDGFNNITYMRAQQNY